MNNIEINTNNDFNIYGKIVSVIKVVVNNNCNKGIDNIIGSIFIYINDNTIKYNINFAINSVIRYNIKIALDIHSNNIND